MFEHKGIKIDVTDRGTFTADVGDVSITRYTLAEVQSEIDKELKANEVKREISLPVVCIISPDGKYSAASRLIHEGILTGLNRTTREPIISGVPKGCDLKQIVPRTDKNLRALTNLLHLQVALESKTKEIEALMFASNLGSGRIKAEEYGDALDRLESKYGRAVASEATA